MPAKDEKKKRPAPISYRPPKGREAEFYERVAASGLPVNAFLNERVFGRGRRPQGEQQELARLLAAAARISDQLHNIALSGDAQNALPIEQAHEELHEIRAALLSLMGRKP